MESAVHAAVPLRVGKKMRKRRELDALVGGGGGRGGRLLSASSDEGEPWARRSCRRRRSRPFVRLAAALALCVCVVSAATVLWLFVDVRRQIVSLRIEMDRGSFLFECLPTESWMKLSFCLYFVYRSVCFDGINCFVIYGL